VPFGGTQHGGRKFSGRGGACPQTPLAACAFGSRNLPRLVLKSGYDPVSVVTKSVVNDYFSLLWGINSATSIQKIVTWMSNGTSED